MQAQGIAALAPGQAAPMQNPALRNQPTQGTNAGLPPDLKQLLVQQSRNELAQAAQRHMALQQALQRGQGQGQPPTVAQQVQMQSQRDRAAVAGPAMQTQEMQKQAGLQQLLQAQRGVPERPPQPESQGIAELPVPEFGMAGGGIVAFQSGKEVPSGVAGDIPGFVPGDFGARPPTDASPEEYENWWDTIGKFLQRLGTSGLVPPSIRAAYESRGERAEQPAPRAVPSEKPAPAPTAAPRREPTREDVPFDATWGGTRLAPGYEQGTLEKWRTQAPPLYAAYTAKFPESVAPRAAPAPKAGVATSGAMLPAGSPTGIAVLDQRPAPTALESAVDKSLIEGIQAKPTAQAGAGTEEYERRVGLEALLKQQQAIIDERKARQAAAAQQRLPAWVMGGLQATQPRGGGLGSLLASWGAGTAKATQGYATADEAAAADIDTLRTKMIEAQITGNRDAAKVYGDLLQKYVGTQSQALQSGVSKLNVEENAAQRRESSAQAAIARVEAARERAAAMGLDTSRIDAENRRLLMDQYRIVSDALDKIPPYAQDPASVQKRKDLQAEIDGIRVALSKLGGAGTQGAGGTSIGSQPGWSAKLKP